MNKDILTTGEVAKYYRVSHRTVLTWIEDGKLASYQTPGGHHRITMQQLSVFSRKFAMPEPQKLVVSERRKILVVDDDRTLVDALSRFIESDSDDYSVEAAYNGFSAGKKLATFDPDVVLLDIRMPGIDGLEIARQIKNGGQTGTQVIVMSGYVDEAIRNELASIGVDACLEKPIRMDDLMHVLSRADR